MVDREKHLSHLFQQAGRQLDWPAQRVNYHLGWVHSVVRDGYYKRVRRALERTLVRASSAKERGR